MEDKSVDISYMSEPVVAIFHPESKAILTPVQGLDIHVYKYPNWFWRKMTWLAFGWKWEKSK